MLALSLEGIFSGAKLLIESTSALLTQLLLFGELVICVVRGSVGIFAGRGETGGAWTLCIDLAADHCVVDVLNRIVQVITHTESDVRRLVDRHARFVEEREGFPEGRVGRLDVGDRFEIAIGNSLLLVLSNCCTDLVSCNVHGGMRLVSGAGGFGTALRLSLFACGLSNVRFAQVEALAVEVDEFARPLHGELGAIAELGNGSLLLRHKRCRCGSRGCLRKDVAAVLKKEHGMQRSNALCIFCGLGITVDVPVVFGIKVKCAAEVGVSSTLDLTLLDGVDGIRAGTMEDIVLNGILWVVKPCFLDETAVEQTVEVVLDVLKRMVGKRLSRQKLSSFGRGTRPKVGRVGSSRCRGSCG